MSIIGFFDSVGRDLRHALRGLPRRPAFTFAAVLTLALGIGATTAIFSVVYSVLIKPLPYPNADELVRIRHSARSIAMISLRARTCTSRTGHENRTFASIGLWQESVRDADRPRRVGARARSSSHGRHASGARRAADARTLVHGSGARTRGRRAGPVILSHAFWQRRFGGDEAALGRELSIETESGNGTLRWTGPSQVVGIMPPDFRFLDMTPQPDVIVAVRLDPARQAHGIYCLANARATQARRHPGRGACRPRAHRADLARRMATVPRNHTRSVRELANHARRTLAEGRLGRRRREHDLGAHGCDRRGAARRLRQHRESHARAGGRAAAGVRGARRARRRPGANRERVARRELRHRRSGRRARLAARLRRTTGARRHRPEQPAAPSGDRRLSARARVHVAVSLASTLVFGSITALKHALHVDTSEIRSTRAARPRAASAARRATRWSSCRWRSRSCWS